MRLAVSLDIKQNKTENNKKATENYIRAKASVYAYVLNCSQITNPDQVRQEKDCICLLDFSWNGSKCVTDCKKITHASKVKSEESCKCFSDTKWVEN